MAPRQTTAVIFAVHPFAFINFYNKSFPGTEVEPTNSTTIIEKVHVADVPYEFRPINGNAIGANSCFLADVLEGLRPGP